MAPAMIGSNQIDQQLPEENMPILSKLSKTDLSAMLSVAMFGMTILISAVGPAEAGSGLMITDGSVSPTVSYKA